MHYVVQLAVFMKKTMKQIEKVSGIFEVHISPVERVKLDKNGIFNNITNSFRNMTSSFINITNSFINIIYLFSNIINSFSNITNSFCYNTNSTNKLY